MASTSCKVEKAKGTGITVIDGDMTTGSISDSGLDIVPKGFHRVRYFQVLMNRQYSQTRYILNELIHEGKAERKRFRILDIDNRPNLIQHYRIIHDTKKDTK